MASAPIPRKNPFRSVAKFPTATEGQKDFAKKVLTAKLNRKAQAEAKAKQPRPGTKPEQGYLDGLPDYRRDRWRDRNMGGRSV